MGSSPSKPPTQFPTAVYNPYTVDLKAVGTKVFAVNKADGSPFNKNYSTDTELDFHLEKLFEHLHLLIIEKGIIEQKMNVKISANIQQQLQYIQNEIRKLQNVIAFLLGIDISTLQSTSKYVPQASNTNLSVSKTPSNSTQSVPSSTGRWDVDIPHPTSGKINVSKFFFFYDRFK